MRILLTNDDGVDAPALVPFAQALGRLGTGGELPLVRAHARDGVLHRRCHERVHVAIVGLRETARQDGDADHHDDEQEDEACDDQEEKQRERVDRHR